MLSKRLDSRIHLRALLVGLCLMTGVFLFAGASAQARLVRPFTGQSFGPAGLRPENFDEPISVAVDQKTGEVFVLEINGGGEIYKFNAAGEPVNFSSTGANMVTGTGDSGAGSELEIAVDSSSGPDSGDIYVANNQDVRIYNAAGAPIGELSGGEMCGVAVDPSGGVYVGIYPETVRKYAPSANPVTNADETASMSGLDGVCNVAADSEGSVYAATFSGGVRKYAAMQFGSLAAVGTLVDEQGRTLGIDPSTNDVYINEESRIAAYSPAGELLSVTGEGEANVEGNLHLSFGIAVKGGGELYAPRGRFSEGRIDIFGAPVLRPDATTEPATEISETGASLNGAVNPGGLATTYQFQYGATIAYGSVTPADPATVGTDSTTHHLSAMLSGLPSSSTYHYRIVASNANGTTVGADQVLQTSGPPTLEESRYQGVASTTRSTATITAGVNPHEIQTEAWIEYGTTAAYGEHTAHLEAEGGSLLFELTGLQPDTEYHYRIVIRNAKGVMVYGSDRQFSTFGAATIKEETALEVGSTSATVSASLYDLGLESIYYYEYGTNAIYGSTTQHQISASASGAGGSIPATTELAGLQSSTQYHFRLVVENSAGTSRGGDATFITAASASLSVYLPDGREYEKVSPNANGDGDVYQDEPLTLASLGGYTELPFAVSTDGRSIAYPGDPAEKGGIGHEGPDAGNEYVATRAAGGGWSAANVDPPSTGRVDVPVYQGFSSDLSVGFLTSNGTEPLAAGAPGDGFAGVYKRSFASGAFEPLLTSTPPNRSAGEFGAYGWPTTDPVAAIEPAYAGSSTDLTHSLFMANDALTPGAVDGGPHANNLYDSHEGAMTLVNVLPDGSTEANATFGGPVPPPTLEGEDIPAFGHDISEDGTRIFWTDLNTHSLYVRENDTAPPSPVSEGKCTVAADACTVLIADNAQYWNATPDGSTVLYSKEGDLYEYDLSSGQSIDIAPGAESLGVVGTSEDLSYVYFVGDGAIAPGATAQHCEAETTQEETGEVPQTSGCNLYSVHVGESRTIHYIAALASGDIASSPESFYRTDGDWLPGLGNKEAEATPDGTHLLFTSRRALTGIPSHSLEQIYLYDFSSGQLSCVSCNTDQESAKGAAFLPVSHMGTYLPHWMTDDGDRIFFDTLDPLVPQDTNGTTDVYEWERSGSGSCSDSPGCIYLVSDGTSREGSYLIGTTANGDDVFFTTRARLVGEDQNENVDVYDARVGATQPPTAPQCTGTGCQGVPSAPPVFATPASSTYDGVGNLEAPTTASVKPEAASKPLTRAQKLADTLKACRKKRQKKKQVACEKQARKSYGARSTSHTSVKRGSATRASKKRSMR